MENELCGCEESVALRAEIETLRRGEGCHHPSCCRAVEKELSQMHVRQCDLNQQCLELRERERIVTEMARAAAAERDKLRELARELVAVAERIGTDADLWIEGEQLLAKAKALGVEVGR